MQKKVGMRAEPQSIGQVTDASTNGSNELLKEDYFETSRKTKELLSRQGWCLWKCRLFNNETILVVEEDDFVARQFRLVGPLIVAIRYPVYSTKELHMIATAEEATAQLINEDKKLFGAHLLSVEEVRTGGSGVRWKKWTPKSGKIERRRCLNERDSAGKVHEGVSRGSGETDNGREAIITGGSPPVVPAAIDARELGEAI